MGDGDKNTVERNRKVMGSNNVEAWTSLGWLETANVAHLTNNNNNNNLKYLYSAKTCI